MNANEHTALLAHIERLRAIRDEKQAALSEAQIALNGALIDLNALEAMMERAEREVSAVRRVIAIEGRETTDGRLIAPGALTWSDGPIPIKTAYGLGDYVGKATNLRREDDGTITADIDIKRPVDDDEFFIPFVVIITSHLDDSVLYLTAGRIHDLTLMGPLEWPWKTEE